MQMKRDIIVLLVMSFAILALSPERAAAVGTCTQAELDNYECSVDAQEYFEVRIIKPFPLVAACSDNLPGETKSCSTYRYQVTQLPAAPYSADHVNLIVERPFADLIVGDGLDCDGSGDNSTMFAGYLTWNCLYRWDDVSTGELSLEVSGGTDSAPSDWFIKVGYDPFTPSAWGIILAPALVERPEIIARTADEFTYLTNDIIPQKYTVKVNKDLAGNIISIIRTRPDGVEEDITNTGIPIELFEVSYDGGISYESLKFIPNSTVAKTGEFSTCAYFYNGYYYNFCGYTW